MKRFSLGAAVAAILLAPAAPALADGIEDKAAVCAACHGDKGLPSDPKFPIIWGQHVGYLYTELKDMKSGARKNDVMAPLLQDMTKEDLLALAEYFEAKPWPSTGYVASEADAKAAAPIEVAAQCSACHHGDYKGDSNAPRLAGQQVEYLIKTTHDFKTKERANNSFMNDMLSTFKDGDIATMSRFVAGQ